MDCATTGPNCQNDHSKMTNNYFESKEFQESLSLYQKSKREGDSCYLDSDEFISISDYYVEEGNVKEAENALTLALRIHPDSKQLMVAYAGVLLCDYQFEKAKETIIDVTEEDCYDVLYLYAQLSCAVDHEYDKGESFFRQWITHIDSDFDDEDLEYRNYLKSDDEERYDFSSKRRDARFRIIMSYLEFTDEKSQDRYVKRWMKDYLRKFDEIGRYTEDYSMAKTCYELGYYNYLDEFLNRILDLNPYYEQGWTMLGISQQYRGLYNEAENSLQFALAINPDSPLANVTYAQCMLSTSNYEKALHFLLKSQLLTGDSSYDYYIGKCYYKLGQTDKAIEYFERIFDSFIKKDVDDFNKEAYFDLAESLYLCNKIDNAFFLVDKILDLDPTHLNTRMLLACLYLHKNCFYEATDIFSEIIAESDFNEQLVTDIASRLIAYDYDKLAIFLLKTIIKKIETKHNQIYNKVIALFSIAYYKEKRHKECLFYLKILCDKSPELVKAYFYSIIPDSVLQTDYYEYLSTQINKS